IAYEPIWAIGTGLAATPEDAQEACAWIRSTIREAAGEETASSVRIQYGGSVTPENAESLLTCSDVDGALVGGASLDAGAFVDIIRGGGRRGR
ncbi:MAG TPA: triose-phosphate isomerase, partial [Acidimicrobiales bacterium]|nr:triose-phosphate isomerase [Acidimicrobiales bacterium]